MEKRVYKEKSVMLLQINKNKKTKNMKSSQLQPPPLSKNILLIDFMKECVNFFFSWSNHLCRNVPKSGLQ